MNNVRLLPPSSRILLTLACAISFALLSINLYFSPFGIDFTDEGFYFNWYKYPDSYPAAVTFFGFVYALPYQLLGENIIALRVVNILSVFAASMWCVDQAFACSTRIRGYIVRPTTRLAFAFSLSGLSLLGLGKFSSPSYNHLALIGCFLVAGTLLRIGPLDDSNKIVYFSLGLPFVSGIVLASLAKPTTGIVLGTISLAFALLSKRSSRNWMLLCLFLSAILSLLITTLFSGGFSALLEKTMLGKQWISFLAGGHDIKGLAKSIVQAILYPPFLPFVIILVLQERICSYLFRSSELRSRAYAFISVVVLSVAFLILLSPLAGFLARSGMSSITGTWFFAMPLVFALYVVRNKSLGSVNIDEALPLMSVTGASRLLLILLIPFGYGFGTNTGIWGKALSASLIFVCVAAYLLAQLPSRSLKTAISGFLLSYLIGAVLVAPSQASFCLNPQRQPQPLFLNKSVTRIGKVSQLRLSSGFSNYIESTRLALLKNEFKPGTPILDLSGQSPGLIYAVEGRAIGQAWMIGGYKGSNLLGENAIARIPCKDLYTAWLIVEPEGPRSLDLSILQSHRINIQDPAKYEKIADIAVPSGAGGYTIDRRQFIYKPLSDENVALRCS